ncbi:protein-methionine-sulfoxide reductase heme-binding subunit MsrQ [Shewanella surugensis]|uniref:Protein-methionine-sulfoxide reductase heme-binding subunit MsrQ n=1 Tax=Shewanella surugensis TaxID=212020 RepID=A0ABT0LCA0_9GAMM|nr:protein-methionine-sulfoxide reductase heme-binding subunit MsrQ [Shewanella surugensis]MCL1125130.1 protein-methionine-sulfoxide reductase heme-binding subunit MsrQ [Shewanella surugensis]
MRLSTKKIFSIKIFAHLTGMLPLLYLLLKVLEGQAGGDPVQYIIHFTGMGALNSVVLTLLISPLAKQFKLGGLLNVRRLVGLYAFSYASLHVLAFFSLDLLFAWSLFFSEVAKRPYILLGLLAYVLLMALALTSFSHIKRKMRGHWQKLHNWIYVIAVLVPIHFYWSVKSEVIEPSLYLLTLFILLCIRVKKFNIFSSKKTASRQ